MALLTHLLPPAEERTTPSNSLVLPGCHPILCQSQLLSPIPLEPAPGYLETTGALWRQALCSAGQGTIGDVENDSLITLFSCETQGCEEA